MRGRDDRGGGSVVRTLSHSTPRADSWIYWVLNQFLHTSNIESSVQVI